MPLLHNNENSHIFFLIRGQTLGFRAQCLAEKSLGMPFLHQHSPMAKSLASVSRAKGLSKLGRANTGACTKDVFKVETVLSCSEVQTNRVFSKKIGEGLADNPKMSDKLTVITSQA
jgi:hypothetical protein